MILNGPGISYTEPDIGSEFVPPLPEHPREAIVKLCEHCTNRLLHRDELLGYEYWSFAEAATDEQAEVLCKMKMRRPYTLPEMVKLTGMPEADIEKMLDDMSYTGLLEYNWENPERAKQWVLPMLVPGSAEFLNMRVSQLEEHPVYAKFFEQASKGPLSKATPMVPPGGAGIGMHVIPVEKAIDAASTSVPIEHIEHWLDKYEGKYAASTCSCRASRRVMGEGCADDPADWCIAVGDMADYVVETDRGHYVTREEVYDHLAPGRGQRLCAPDHQHRRREQDLRHLQLQRQRVLRPAHLAAVQHAQPVALGLCRQGREGQVRGLRSLR